MTKNCSTCRHAQPVTVRFAGFLASDYRHCAVPRADGIPSAAWMIGAESGCGHGVSKWEPATDNE